VQQTCEGNVDKYFMHDVSEIPEKIYDSTKLRLDVIGLKKTHTFSRACEPLTIVKL